MNLLYPSCWLFVVVLLATSCQSSPSQPQKAVEVLDSIPVVLDSTTAFNPEPVAPPFNPYPTAEQFLADVRDEVPYTIQVFPADTVTNIPYLSIFPKETLEKTTLYLVKKERPLRRIQYPHIFLSIAQYSSKEAGKQAFEAMLKMAATIKAAAAEGGRPPILDPYHGGFLMRKGSYIYSLRKLCGYNKLNLRFKEYEEYFLKTFQHEPTDSKIIWAACGDFHFSILDSLEQRD